MEIMEPRIPGSSDDRQRVVLEPGRWTTQRPDETPSQALNRLTAGDGEPLPLEISRTVPRFRSGGRPRK
jgi:hypothetical protein